MKAYLVTGGSGFIGSNFIRQELAKGNRVINLDILSYASNPKNLADIEQHPDYVFIQGDIGDQALVGDLLKKYEVNALINFAAESHVDNSISGPDVFVMTNIVGTYHLLTAALSYWQETRLPDFRFLHVSTDEVYGDLPLDTADRFSEKSPYKPSSPYSASKAASDHLVHAWHRTYGLPVIITNCSNNYGPYQNHEKLIPRMIQCALKGMKLPVYGRGENIRDWIYVGDHCRGIALALESGRVGDTYCLGGNSERRNIDIVRLICAVLDKLAPKQDGSSYADQISFVTDRPGHDLRYAIDDAKARDMLGYKTDVIFEERFEQTIGWYLDNRDWLNL